MTDADKEKMSLDVARNSIYKAATFNICNKCNYLHIIFHGGEPLLWGIHNFISILLFEDEFVSEHPSFRFYNSIQTNASMLDHDYIELFNKYSMNIGVSIDGPEEINFHKSSTGILDKITMLNEAGSRYGILSVITEKHRGKAKDYYEFMQENKIKSAGLCYCFDPIGGNTVSNDALSEFLIELFDLYFYGSYKCRIREFDCVIKKCLGKETHNCNFQCRKNCGKYYSIFPNGDVQFCDDYEYKGHIIGNILVSDFSDIISSVPLREILKRINDNYVSKCQPCSMLDLCGGGCFRNDMQDGTNYFCKSYFSVYSHISKIVNKYRKEGK